jgi:DNA-binding MurR/RpiR family transcriptional regulator
MYYLRSNHNNHSQDGCSTMTQTFDERISAKLHELSPAEQRVAQFFQDNREEVLVSSASLLAEKAATSDATVIRTTKALGYRSLDELRRELAAELRSNLSPASRLTRTLSEVGDNLASALGVTIDIHVQALERLRRDIDADLFARVVDRIIGARHTFVFGIGPSSAMADYSVMQLGRFGLEATSLTHTGLLLADGMRRLKHEDVLIILAYGRLYSELDALLNHAKQLKVATILVTDTLAGRLRSRVDEVLTVARGRSDMMSMHTATLGLIEAILVGIATRRPTETIASLKALNALRGSMAGQPMDLPSSRYGARPAANRTRRKHRD